MYFFKHLYIEENKGNNIIIECIKKVTEEHNKMKDRQTYY